MAYTPPNWAAGSWAPNVWADGSWGSAGVVTPETPRTAAGGPTGVRHRKRYLFPTPEEVAALEASVLHEALAAVPAEEADDSEMLEALAAFLAEGF